MKVLWKTTLYLTLIGNIGEMVAVAQTKTAPPAAPVAAPVKDVLPKAAPSPQIEALRKELSGVIVFRDPVTGEFGPAGPGEQAALTGNRSGLVRSAAPTTGVLPNGGLYLQMDPARMEFLIAVKKADGTVSFQPAPAGDQDAGKSKGGRDEK